MTYPLKNTLCNLSRRGRLTALCALFFGTLMLNCASVYSNNFSTNHVVQEIHSVKIMDVYELDTPDIKKKAAFGKLLFLYKEGTNFGCKKNLFVCNRLAWAWLDPHGDLYELPISELELTKQVLKYQEGSNLLDSENGWEITVPAHLVETLGGSRSIKIEIKGDSGGSMSIRTTYSLAFVLGLTRVNPFDQSGKIEEIETHIKSKIVAPFVVGTPTENKYFALPRGPKDMGYVIYSDFNPEVVQSLHSDELITVKGLAFFQPVESDPSSRPWDLYTFEIVMNKYLYMGINFVETKDILKRFRMSPLGRKGTNQIYYHQVKMGDPSQRVIAPELYFSGLNTDQLRYEPLDVITTPQRIFSGENTARPPVYYSSKVPTIHYKEVPLSGSNSGAIKSPEFRLASVKSGVGDQIVDFLTTYSQPALDYKFWEALLNAADKDSSCAKELTP